MMCAKPPHNPPSASHQEWTYPRLTRNCHSHNNTSWILVCTKNFDLYMMQTCNIHLKYQEHIKVWPFSSFHQCFNSFNSLDVLSMLFFSMNCYIKSLSQYSTTSAGKTIHILLRNTEVNKRTDRKERGFYILLKSKSMRLIEQDVKVSNTTTTKK